MSALEQLRNGKTGREKTAKTRRKLRFLIKRLLPVSFENIGFSRLVPGKLPVNISNRWVREWKHESALEARPMTEPENEIRNALVAAIHDADEAEPGWASAHDYADHLLGALAARGLEIREKQQ